MPSRVLPVAVAVQVIFVMGGHANAVGLAGEPAATVAARLRVAVQVDRGGAVFEVKVRVHHTLDLQARLMSVTVRLTGLPERSLISLTAAARNWLVVAS